MSLASAARDCVDVHVSRPPSQRAAWRSASRTSALAPALSTPCPPTLHTVHRIMGTSGLLPSLRPAA
eukprot:2339403-Pleurochrysis_carterae.AAC.1